MKNPTLSDRLSAYEDKWESAWEEFTQDETLQVDPATLEKVAGEFSERMKDNYPFFHPRYAGQMLKPPHPIAAAAYQMAMRNNPNNHALDGGPATAKMEIEVVADLAKMFGYKTHLGHLTSSGTIANLEALWVSRSLHPSKSIAFSSSAHYTHKRMCEVIKADAIEIPSDAYGRIDCDELERELKTGKVGTVVATIGTTSLGALDPLDQIIPLCRRYHVRIHADAAYGGFFMLLARQKSPLVNAAPYLHLFECDSIVVDPHKHGLQPYGCGCILFSDPSVGRFYKHDSPYTYFTSDALHLGEISLECSRPGAAAAALWFTLRCIPLLPDSGLGAILTKTRKSALEFSRQIASSKRLNEFVKPELDIVTYFPNPESPAASRISQLSEKIFSDAMHHPSNPLYLALLHVSSGLAKKLHPHISADTQTMTVLRSALMKPEHLGFVPQLVKELEELTAKGME
ncbi:MAG TPA: aminotransferase class I/II-fold pyridoxal phosphate-dependent enzyme [Bacteroidota bacterium]|nr:aminotransferase class I/II-fold pyridoxal phosphate-dependent enzyme [Bacteroidota bacterium]